MQRPSRCRRGRRQRQRVPSGHPRLFLRPEDLPRLRELAGGKLAADFAKLRTEADKIIKAGPTPEPEHLGSARDKENERLIKYWWPNREQTEKACQEAETLAFVYLLTQEQELRRGGAPLGAASGLVGSRRPDEFPPELRGGQAACSIARPAPTTGPTTCSRRRTAQRSAR